MNSAVPDGMVSVKVRKVLIWLNFSVWSCIYHTGAVCSGVVAYQ